MHLQQNNLYIQMPTLLKHRFYLPCKPVFGGRFERSHVCTCLLIKPFFIIMIVVILCVLTSNSHYCMGWKVSYVLLPSLFAFIQYFHHFPFSQVASDYFSPYFPRIFSGQASSKLERSTFTKATTLFHCFQMFKPLQHSIL